MASIVPYREGWRAYVLVAGKRKTKTFRLKAEAKRWADEVEATDGAHTFETVAEAFLKLKLPRLTNAANQQGYENSIRDHVLPVIGKRKVQDIRRIELVSLVKGIADRGTVETAHRVGQRIASILDHAVDLGLIELHPAADLARVLPRKAHIPLPALGAAELPALLKAIDSYPEPVTRIGLLLLAHTFVRTSELVGARWDELKDDVWIIPAERMKRRIPHVVPISPRVRKLLDELEPMTGESDYWLASPINRGTSISYNTMLFGLYRLGYKGKMTGHGFRSIASSVLNESGKWHKDAIERQLAHKETDDVRGTYMRAEFLEERARMMHWYSGYLDKASKTTS